MLGSKVGVEVGVRGGHRPERFPQKQNGSSKLRWCPFGFLKKTGFLQRPKTSLFTRESSKSCVEGDSLNGPNVSFQGILKSTYPDLDLRCSAVWL